MQQFEPSNRELAEHLNVSEKAISARVGNSEEIDHYRARINKILRSNVLGAVRLINKLMARAITELDKAKPNPAVIGSARAGAIATLQGTGVFQEHQTVTARALDAGEIGYILDRAEAIRAELEGYQAPNSSELSPGKALTSAKQGASKAEAGAMENVEQGAPTGPRTAEPEGRGGPDETGTGMGTSPHLNLAHFSISAGPVAPEGLKYDSGLLSIDSMETDAPESGDSEGLTNFA